MATKPILRAGRFEQIFKKAFDTATKHREVISLENMTEAEREDFHERQKRLHPSSLPYCGLRDAWSILSGEGREVELGSQYYFSAGHAFHAAVQQALGSAALAGGDCVYGDWACRLCGHVEPFQPKPEGSCPQCGKRRWEYKELGGVSLKGVKGCAPISWHSDGLFFVAGEYWVLDYKTTNSASLAAHRKNGDVFPYKANREQIRAYCVLVQKKYKVPVAGWALVYVGRDKPNSVQNVEVVAERVEDGDIEEWTKRLVAASKAKYLASKVKEHPVAVFKKLQPMRLCPTEDFYERNIRTPWEPCPLADYCQNLDELIPALEVELKALSE